MSSNRDIVSEAFRSWADGTGYVGSIFADTMTWQIPGRSAVSRFRGPVSSGRYQAANLS